MKITKKVTDFVSEIDQFLSEFDHKHPQKSLSQQKEMTTYRRIYYLRDVADRSDDKQLSDWF